MCVCMQALQILALFQDKGILRHVMKIPSELRSGAEFERCYSNLVKALVPTRGQLVARGSRRKSRTPSTTSNYSITSAFTGRSQQKDSIASMRSSVKYGWYVSGCGYQLALPVYINFIRLFDRESPLPTALIYSWTHQKSSRLTIY